MLKAASTAARLNGFQAVFGSVRGRGREIVQVSEEKNADRRVEYKMQLEQLNAIMEECKAEIERLDRSRTQIDGMNQDVLAFVKRKRTHRW
jgi:hypothetical protein